MAVRHLYDEIGIGYRDYRRPDHRIYGAIVEALGDCESVVNVGAGTGSYEPTDRAVVAIEPSWEMIRQRPDGSARCVRASATHLPFGDDELAAALAVLTVHHWPELGRGLRELSRVARRRVVILTHDPDVADFWLVSDYFPAIRDVTRRILAPLTHYRSVLGEIEIRAVPVPHDCTDGFLGAYWRALVPTSMQVCAAPYPCSP